MRPVTTLMAAVGLLLTAGACTQNEPRPPRGGDDPHSVAVTSTDDTCDLSVTSAPAGRITFTVSNAGTEGTEFYVLDEAGTRVLGEVENVGPGLSRPLVVSLEAGSYTAACKPGMAGAGISSEFTVEAEAD